MAIANEIKAGVYRFKINGTEAEPWVIRAIQRVAVEDDLNLPSQFSIDMAIMVETQKTPSQSSDRLFYDRNLMEMMEPGTEVEIMMGLNTPEHLMKGKIASIEASFGRKSTLNIVGYDALHELSFGRKTQSYVDMTDSDIAEQIAGNVSLQSETTSTSVKHDYVLQNNVSDFAFLIERAERIGFEVAVREGALLFREPAESESASVSLEFGKDLTDFTVSMKALPEGSETEFRSWDYKNKTAVSGRAKKGDEAVQPAAGEQSGFAISTKISSSAIINRVATAADDEEAELLARARYNEFLRHFITGDGNCPGEPTIRSGSTIEILGLGPKLSGVYYVTSSKHIWSAGSYTTTFKVRRTAL